MRDLHFIEGPAGGLLGRRILAAYELEKGWTTSQEDLDGRLQVALFFRVFPVLDALVQFLEAHDRASWPATLPRQPLVHTCDVASAILRAHHPSAGAAPGVAVMKRIVMLEAANRWSLPAIAQRFDIGMSDAQRQWPRLFEATRQAALLTSSEVASTLVTWHRAPRSQRIGSDAAPSPSEAVAHFGGLGKVLEAARRWHSRQAVRSKDSTTPPPVEAPQPPVKAAEPVQSSSNGMVVPADDGKGGFHVVDPKLKVNLAPQEGKPARRFKTREKADQFAAEAEEKPWSELVFKTAITEFLKVHGVQPTDGQGAYEWRIDTHCGGLEIAVHDCWIATRFQDPPRAKPFALGMNPHSGKWNFHEYPSQRKPLAVRFMEDFKKLLAFQPAEV